MGKDKTRAEKNAIERAKILELLGGKCCIHGCTRRHFRLIIHHRWYHVKRGEYPSCYASYDMVKSNMDRFRLLCLAHHNVLNGLFKRSNIEWRDQTRQNERKMFNLIIADASDGGSGLLKRITKTRENNIGKQRKRQERAKNPEKYNEQMRKYYAENPEKCREYARRYYAKNPEKCSERRSKYYAENPEKFREYNRQTRAKDPEKCRERDRNYRAKNRDRLRERARQRYAENRDIINERARQRYAENPGKYNERTRQRRAENPGKYKEKDREYGRRYRAKNRDWINERRRQARAKRRKEKKKVETNK